MKKTINELHSDTRILINRLESAFTTESRDFISYAELSQSIGGRDVQGSARGLLITARKHVQVSLKCLIRTVRNEGLKKTDDVIGEIDNTAKHVGRAVKRTIRECLVATDGKEMENQQSVEFHARMSQLGAIAVFTQKKAASRIEGKIKELNIHSDLPTAETIRLFEK